MTKGGITGLDKTEGGGYACDKCGEVLPLDPDAMLAHVCKVPPLLRGGEPSIYSRVLEEMPEPQRRDLLTNRWPADPKWKEGDKFEVTIPSGGKVDYYLNGRKLKRSWLRETLLVWSNYGLIALCGIVPGTPVSMLLWAYDILSKRNALLVGVTIALGLPELLKRTKLWRQLTGKSPWPKVRQLSEEETRRQFGYVTVVAHDQTIDGFELKRGDRVMVKPDGNGNAHLTEDEVRRQHDRRTLREQEDHLRKTHQIGENQYLGTDGKVHLLDPHFGPNGDPGVRCSNCGYPFEKDRACMRCGLVGTFLPVETPHLELNIADGQPAGFFSDQTQTEPLEDPKWEVISDSDGVMHHVRWSKPNKRDEYFMCAHYPEKWRAESQAKRWNDEGKSPYEFREFARTE